jgi:hypothetical protein
MAKKARTLLPSSGRELINRTQNTTEDKQEAEEKFRSEVFILCGVVTVTFRVSSRFVVTKHYSYSKIVLQLLVVPPAE